MPSIKDLPTTSLLQRALDFSDKDPKSDERYLHDNATSDERWVCVAELHRRCEPEIFEAAKNWCARGKVVEKILAAFILGEFGPLRQEGEEELRPFTKPTIPVLEKLLDDPDARVVASAVDALKHHNFRDQIAERDSLTSHTSWLVRKTVASVLGGHDASPAAIRILIKLSQDNDGDVRDWATFGLGDLCSLNTLEIREALFARVNDEHSDTRSEALLGLAKKNDDRVIPFIKAELEAEMVGNLEVEAAGEIASGVLVEPLKALLKWWDVDTELLHAALQRCRGEANPDEDWRWDNHSSDEA